MQQFWLKLLLVLSTGLSANAAIAVSLSSLLNIDHATPSLLVDAPSQLNLTSNDGIFSKNSHSKLVKSLSLLVQQKTVEIIVNEEKLSVFLTNTCCHKVINSWDSVIYNQARQQQNNVHRDIQAQKNTHFQGQASYQAERQKSLNSLSKFN